MKICFQHTFQMNLRTSVYRIWGLETAIFPKENPGTYYPKRHRGSTFSYMLREHPFPGLKGEEVCSLCVIMLMLSYYVPWVLELKCIWLFPYYALGRFILKHRLPIWLDLSSTLTPGTWILWSFDAIQIFFETFKYTVVAKFYCSWNIML